MSDPLAPGSAPGEHPQHSEDLAGASAAAAPPGSKGTRRAAVRRVVTGRPWITGAVAGVVLVAGTAAVTAAAMHHHGEGIAYRAVAPGPDGLPGPKRLIAQAGPDGGTVVVEGGKAVKVPGGPIAGPRDLLDQRSIPESSGTAPAPLPAVPADQAVTKATAAVPGGKVESLRPVPEQGGGTAWQAIVLGPDGVRHLVTLDGATGAITSNTTLGG